MVEMITFTTDGIALPFNIQLSAETKLPFMPSTRDLSDEKDSADGDIDQGTEFKADDGVIRGIIEFSCIEERNTIEENLLGQLYECLSYQELVRESNPDKYLLVRLSGKPEIVPYASWFDITIPLKCQPFWYSTEEHVLVGNGTILNAGTFETGVIIEFSGYSSEPSIEFGETFLEHSLAINVGQKLIIDTNACTVKRNSANAMVGYNNVFPKIPHGEVVSVYSPWGNQVVYKWRDCWI